MRLNQQIIHSLRDSLCVLTDCFAVTLTDDTAEGADPAQFRVFRLNKLRALFDETSDDHLAYIHDVIMEGKGAVGREGMFFCSCDIHQHALICAPFTFSDSQCFLANLADNTF